MHHGGHLLVDRGIQFHRGDDQTGHLLLGGAEFLLGVGHEHRSVEGILLDERGCLHRSAGVLINSLRCTGKQLGIDRQFTQLDRRKLLLRACDRLRRVVPGTTNQADLHVLRFQVDRAVQRRLTTRQIDPGVTCIARRRTRCA